MTDFSLLIAVGALLLAGLVALSKVLDKSLSIREYEAYREAVARDVHRIELRLNHIEQTRPTTGELEILSDALNKRVDEIIRRGSD